VNINKSISTKATPVALGAISAAFTANTIVSPSSLYKKGLVTKVSGQLPAIKILATGELDKALIFVNCKVSAAVKETIEKKGGKIK
jgi:ribosomal protein L15